MTPYFGKLTDDALLDYKLMYFDICVENRSNRSIDFDIELKIFNAAELGIILEHELKRDLEKQRQAKRSRNTFDFSITPLHLHNTFSNVLIENFPEYILVRRIKMRNEKTAVNIPQNAQQSAIFRKEIILIGDKTGTLKAEVLIRSDDFTDGFLQQLVELKLPH